MQIKEFQSVFKLEGNVLGIRRVKGCLSSNGAMLGNSCAVWALNHALNGETIIFTAENSTCRGGLTGMGFRDGLPPTPGGFGRFISSGGEGCPPAQRLYHSPEAGEKMILNQPQRIMEGYDGIEVKPYEDGDEPELVTIFCDADRLSAMCFLFNFGKDSNQYDMVIVPTVSGCASIFRVPFGELRRAEPRAVVGLTDLNARVGFAPGLMMLTVSGKDFKRMLEDADESFGKTKLWQTVRGRLYDTLLSQKSEES